MRKLGNAFLVIVGLVCLWPVYKQLFLVDDSSWKIIVSCLLVSATLFCVGVPNLIYKESFSDLLAKHYWVRISYAIASCNFAIYSGYTVVVEWGINFKTLIGVTGVLFFGAGVFVLLFLDYTAQKRKWPNKKD